MATLVLSAAGAALGAGMGGSVLGVSSMVIGRAAGATLGRVIDQRLLGAGAEAVEVGRIDRLRLSGASEGAVIPEVFGRMRVGGQVIWASDFLETSETTRETSSGGKGAPRAPRVTRYGYSVSLAIGLCRGEILRVARIWADGEEVEPERFNLRLYHGTDDQLPDPKIEAVEGAGRAPAYRGLAYMVIEDLDLGPFGNRVPQFSFEVLRIATPAAWRPETSMTHGTRAVALMPGTGDYALATTPVHGDAGPVGQKVFNVNSAAGGTDFDVALRALGEELPNCGAVSLVVSWFGSDLRAGDCAVMPKLEQNAVDGQQMPWRVCGMTRADASLLARVDGRPVYGSTPSDQSVVEAIRAMRDKGMKVMFYPFLLMEVLRGNGLPDPYGGAEQAALPWRGRITLDRAPGQEGSPDRGAAADAQVRRFFGDAAAQDFAVSEEAVDYVGASGWGYRRFVLHYAHLCRMAGGVDAFCIGSELRGLTRIRGAGDGFPAVGELIALAAEVRGILGEATQIGYAADWSEYSGYRPEDGSGDVYFNLDPLWADANIDFIGIDNYMPLSDWRDGDDHADAAFGSIYAPEYLKANIEGGEGYDWYYRTDAARALQKRTPIADAQHGEHWIYRYKDVRSWWSLPHHERIAGTRSAVASPWKPRSKPIWFTEIGCPAIDKGTNQPNVFLDPKSSESEMPYFSGGGRDDLIQKRYLEALYDYWGDPAHNPYSEVYDGAMIDMARAHVWAWDARPYPQFPADRSLWADGANYARGHWINGRTATLDMRDVVAEICETGGMHEVRTDKLHASLRGMVVQQIETARATLQPLMLAYGFDASEAAGTIVFANRDGELDHRLEPGGLVAALDGRGPVVATRLPNPQAAGRVRVGYVEAEGDYAVRVAEAALSDDPSLAQAFSDLPLALSEAEASAIARRWLAEARIARDRVQLALPPSRVGVGVGDVIEIAEPSQQDGHAGREEPGAGGTAPGRVPAGRYRIDRVTDVGAREIEAVRTEPGVYAPPPFDDVAARVRKFAPPLPSVVAFMDLPLLREDAVPHAPYAAATGVPWPGGVAIFASDQDAGYLLNATLERRAVMGETLAPLERARTGVWSRGVRLRLRIYAGQLSSAAPGVVLNGANAMAIGSGADGDWEVFQFTTADPVEPGVYEITGLLRGQLGTDGVMPEAWPVGSRVVLLNDAVTQLDLASAERDLARHYRSGPVSRSYDDPVYEHRQMAFSGVGLRPYRPCHLRARPESDGSRAVTWTRRTRADGDRWAAVEVPLGEVREAYLLRVLVGGAVAREVTTEVPSWRYGAAQLAADLAAGGRVEIAVAQISERFGAGPFAKVTING